MVAGQAYRLAAVFAKIKSHFDYWKLLFAARAAPIASASFSAATSGAAAGRLRALLVHRRCGLNLLHDVARGHDDGAHDFLHLFAGDGIEIEVQLLHFLAERLVPRHRIETA